MIELLRIAATNPFYAVQIAFQYGYVMGGRAAKAGKYKEGKGGTGKFQAAGDLEPVE